MVKCARLVVWLVVSGLSGAVTAAGTGCKKNDAAAAAPATDPVAAADEQIARKLAFYIDCASVIDPLVSDSKQLYARHLTPDGKVDPERPPLVRPIGPRREACFAGLAEAAELPPELTDLEESGAAYQDALEKLEPMLVAAERSYAQHGGTEEAFVNGQTLHPRLLSAYEFFFAARTRLHDTIGRHHRGVLTRRVVHDARVLVDLAADPSAGRARLGAGIAAFATVWAELSERARLSPAETGRLRHFTAFVSSGERFVRDVEVIGRALAAGAEVTPATRASLLESYRELVEASHGLEIQARP